MTRSVSVSISYHVRGATRDYRAQDNTGRIPMAQSRIVTPRAPTTQSASRSHAFLIWQVTT